MPQTADRRQGRKIDVEPQWVDKAFAHLCAQHFADAEQPLRAEGEAHPAATCEGCRRGGKNVGVEGCVEMAQH